MIERIPGAGIMDCVVPQPRPGGGGQLNPQGSRTTTSNRHRPPRPFLCRTTGYNCWSISRNGSLASSLPSDRRTSPPAKRHQQPVRFRSIRLQNLFLSESRSMQGNQTNQDRPTTSSRRNFMKGDDRPRPLGRRSRRTRCRRSVHAAENNTIKIGLIGCGGRGTGAAASAAPGRPERQARRHGRRLPGPPRRAASSSLKSDRRRSPTRSTSAGTLLRRLRRLQAGDRQRRRRRAPGDAAGFRPLHLKAAVEAGKHVFCREAGRRRRPRRPHGAGDLPRRPRRRTWPSSPASAAATTTPSARR